MSAKAIVSRIEALIDAKAAYEVAVALCDMDGNGKGEAESKRAALVAVRKQLIHEIEKELEKPRRAIL